MPSLTGLDLLNVIFVTDAVISDATKELYIELAAEELGDPCPWGASYAQAVVYLAAHNLILDQVRGADGAPGPITGERAGEVSRQYGWNSNGAREDGLNETSPGRRFLALRAKLPSTKFSSTSRMYQANRKQGCD
jgi:hypothetical protein